MMVKTTQIISLLVFYSFFAFSQEDLRLGADRTEVYIPILKGENLGIVGNQSSLISNTHLVDSLLSLNINVVKIFSPEHGFRGFFDAGAKVSNELDAQTKLPIISLYGNDKKPSSKQLEDITFLIFDIQDVGARFYTYISTLHYVMESAAENNIPLIILDRPNPNGHYIDGPVLDTFFRSFVGMHPVPIVHGMTIGEYAQMINGEKWINNPCDLIIVEMENYNRHISYDLPIKPSPNLPNFKSVNLYPSLCLFEGTNISVGRGTTYPFQHFGAPYFNSDYYFIPQSMIGSKQPKYKDEICYAIDLRFHKEYLSEINLSWLLYSYQQCVDKQNFFNSFFDKLAGTDKLRIQILQGKTADEIRMSWQEDLLRFIKIREKYLIY